MNEMIHQHNQAMTSHVDRGEHICPNDIILGDINYIMDRYEPDKIVENAPEEVIEMVVAGLGLNKIEPICSP